MGEPKRLIVGRLTRTGLTLGALMALPACSSTDSARTTTNSIPISLPPVSVQIVDENEAVRKIKGTYKVGQPYTINGQSYVPAPDAKYRAEGVGSWYGPDFHGKETANGEIFDMNGISAAHRTMPIPSYARVTNLANGRSIVVRVNDRGPFIDDRIIDLSVGTAKALDTYAKGLARVRVEYVGRAPLEGSDDKMLLATLRTGKPAPAPSLVMIASAKPAAVSVGSGDRSAVQGRKNTSSVGTSLGVGGPFVLSSASFRPSPQATSGESQTDRRGEQPVSWSQGQVPALLSPRVESLGLMGGRGLY